MVRFRAEVWSRSDGDTRYRRRRIHRIIICPQALLALGERVVGIDSLNDYYDVVLKETRRDRLLRHNAFSFEHARYSGPARQSRRLPPAS